VARRLATFTAIWRSSIRSKCGRVSSAGLLTPSSMKRGNGPSGNSIRSRLWSRAHSTSAPRLSARPRLETAVHACRILAPVVHPIGNLSGKIVPPRAFSVEWPPGDGGGCGPPGRAWRAWLWDKPISARRAKHTIRLALELRRSATKSLQTSRKMTTSNSNGRL
jgi:hypothetical protein